MEASGEESRNPPLRRRAMSKQTLSYQEAFVETTRLLEGPGALLNGVRDDGAVNTMTIGWATFGVIWGRPIAVVFVRPSRYTYEFMEATPDFTINVLPDTMGKALAFCGTRSGRDVDKFAECDLTLVPGREIRTPSIEEASIVYECRTLHHNDLDPGSLDPSVRESYYPSGDFHRCYYGEIVACYGSLG
ncbi:MAG: flavin reductase family protein [Armatimonadia bacterium]|nr:flavin reductase family protein [Armatimonadia bacterium]